MNNLPKIALGAWAWGNDGTFGGSLTADTLRPIFDKAMENGLNLWDTAYAYGITIIKEASSREGTVILVSNKYIVSTLTIWNSGSRMNEKLENGYGL